MTNRKPGELIEIFGDFWLGMAGAAATGFSKFSQLRREDKHAKGPTPDFFTRASEALTVAVSEAEKVAETTKTELVEKDPVAAK